MVHSSVLKDVDVLCRNAKVFHDSEDHSIEIMLLKHADQNCLEVIGYDSVQGIESNRLYLNAKKVRAKLNRKTIDDQSQESWFEGISAQLKAEQLNRIMDSLTVDFVLSHLHCVVAVEGGQFTISMVKGQESCRGELMIIDFPSYQYASLPAGVIPFRTARSRPSLRGMSLSSDSRDNSTSHVMAAEHLPPPRRPSMALTNIFVPVNKMGSSSGKDADHGASFSERVSARLGLSLSSKATAALDDSHASCKESDSSKPKPEASARRRTFEALSSLANRIIPSSLVPLTRQHSAGSHRGGGISAHLADARLLDQQIQQQLDKEQSEREELGAGSGRSRSTKLPTLSVTMTTLEDLRALQPAVPTSTVGAAARTLSPLPLTPRTNPAPVHLSPAVLASLNSANTSAAPVEGSGLSTPAEVDGEATIQPSFKEPPSGEEAELWHRRGTVSQA